MSWLLDVNLLLASRWMTHPEHEAAHVLLEAQPEFYTTAVVELGFLRVSLSPGYPATWEDTQHSLTCLLERPAHRFLADDLSATDSPESSYEDTTDAHLVRLATRHGLKLATLDKALLNKPWAKGHAFKPLSA